MKRIFSLLLASVIGATLLGSTVLFAEDVTRFRGVESQGKYDEPGLLNVWPEEGLTPKWINEDLGEGWTSVIKVKDRLYLGCLDPDDPKRESVVCLDLDGKKIWQQPTGAVWTKAYSSPRATPTYATSEKPGEDRLLVLSGAGELHCLAAGDGKTLWNKNLSETYATKFGEWGRAESVLVKDGIVFATVCGEKALAVALKLADGEVVWETPSNGDQVAYVTPIIHENLLIVMTAKYITGIDLTSGKSCWQSDYQAIVGPARLQGINCVTPLKKGNRFFVTSGFAQGGVMFEILPEGKGVAQRWANKVLDSYHGGVVELDGRIYGSGFSGNAACLDWNTGETVYSEPWENFGKGVTISADGMLYFYEEKRGMLGLAKPGEKLDVVSRFPVTFGSKEHWAHPVISDGVLYVRHGKALAAFDISRK